MSSKVTEDILSRGSDINNDNDKRNFYRFDTRIFKFSVANISEDMKETSLRPEAFYGPRIKKTSSKYLYIKISNTDSTTIFFLICHIFCEGVQLKKFATLES